MALGNKSRSMSKPKLLLIGWDAADWKVISPLLGSGLMPTLNTLHRRRRLVSFGSPATGIQFHGSRRAPQASPVTRS